MRPSGSPSDRLMGFAEGHFIVTALGFALMLIGIQLGIPFSPATVAVLMLLYVPAGYGVSCMKKWSRPDGRTALKALLRPALVALAWALAGWVLFTSSLPVLGSLGFWLLMSHSAGRLPPLPAVLPGVHPAEKAVDNGGKCDKIRQLMR